MASQIDQYAVFGNPINHSKSPFIHTLFARQTQQSMIYTAQCAPVDGFTEAAKHFLRKVDEVVMLPCHLKRRRTALPIA